jgi:putative transposase
MTPASVHFGRAQTIHDERARVLAAAYAARPERFVREVSRPPELAAAAWINQPKTGLTAQ